MRDENFVCIVLVARNDGQNNDCALDGINLITSLGWMQNFNRDNNFISLGLISVSVQMGVHVFSGTSPFASIWDTRFFQY